MKKLNYCTNKGFKNEIGITLIALVITIIILLILAGITINLALAPGGIVERAQTAGDEYKEAQDKELAGLGKLENMLNEISDKIAENNGSTSGGGTDSSNIDASVTALKAGDYINYDTGVEGINTKTFRVLYDLTSEHGLQIVANTNIGDKITIGGTNREEVEASYNSAKQTLNTASEKYINTAYASDARALGSFPNIGTDGKFTKKNDGFIAFLGSGDDSSYESDFNVLQNEPFGDTWIVDHGRDFTEDSYWIASYYQHLDPGPEESECWAILNEVCLYDWDVWYHTSWWYGYYNRFCKFGSTSCYCIKT